MRKQKTILCWLILSSLLINFSCRKNDSEIPRPENPLGGTTVYRTRTDTLNLIAINQMARDTSVHAPFTIPGSPIYTFDSHNLNMKKGCH